MQISPFRTTLILVLSLFALTLFGDEISFLDQLSEKEEASTSDLVRAFCYLNSLEVGEDDNENYGRLKELLPGLPELIDYSSPAKVGLFSQLAMAHLKIKSGIFYLATKRGRYAARELMLLGIVDYNTSEYELISGLELIRLLQRVADYERD